MRGYEAYEASGPGERFPPGAGVSLKTVLGMRSLVTSCILRSTSTQPLHYYDFAPPTPPEMGGGHAPAGYVADGAREREVSLLQEEVAVLKRSLLASEAERCQLSTRWREARGGHPSTSASSSTSDHLGAAPGFASREASLSPSHSFPAERDALQLQQENEELRSRVKKFKAFFKVAQYNRRRKALRRSPAKHVPPPSPPSPEESPPLQHAHRLHRQQSEQIERLEKKVKHLESLLAQGARPRARGARGARHPIFSVSGGESPLERSEEDAEERAVSECDSFGSESEGEGEEEDSDMPVMHTPPSARARGAQQLGGRWGGPGGAGAGAGGPSARARGGRGTAVVLKRALADVEASQKDLCEGFMANTNALQAQLQSLMDKWQLEMKEPAASAAKMKRKKKVTFDL